MRRVARCFRLNGARQITSIASRFWKRIADAGIFARALVSGGAAARLSVRASASCLAARSGRAAVGGLRYASRSANLSACLEEHMAYIFSAGILLVKRAALPQHFAAAEKIAVGCGRLAGAFLPVVSCCTVTHLWGSLWLWASCLEYCYYSSAASQRCSSTMSITARHRIFVRGSMAMGWRKEGTPGASRL